MRSSSKRLYPWWLERQVYGVLDLGVVTLWHTNYLGVPDAVVSFRPETLVQPGLILHCERYAEMLLDKSSGRRVIGSAESHVDDQEFTTLYPTLCAYLTQTKWPDGSPRIPSTVSVFVDGGIVKCVLKDRDAGLCLWCACPNFTGLYGVLEALLNDPGAEWRVDRQASGQKATRVKR